MNHPQRLRLVPIAFVALSAGVVPGLSASASATHRATVAIVAPPDLPDRGRHPDLVDIDAWLQTHITSLDQLEGQVVAVQFWTFDCSNWLATLEHMQRLEANYHDQGFEIVGVHSPEFDHEADIDNVVAAAERLGVTWPIAVDTDKHNFHAWQQGSTAYWPRIYLLDRTGHIRYDHIGEGRYDEIDAAVRALLAESG